MVQRENKSPTCLDKIGGQNGRWVQRHSDHIEYGQANESRARVEYIHAVVHVDEGGERDYLNEERRGRPAETEHAINSTEAFEHSQFWGANFFYQTGKTLLPAVKLQNLQKFSLDYY